MGQGREPRPIVLQLPHLWNQLSQFIIL